MTLEQYKRADKIVPAIYRLEFTLSRCMNVISEGREPIYVMGEELPIDISKHLMERAAEMLKEKISALKKELNEL